MAFLPLVVRPRQAGREAVGRVWLCAFWSADKMECSTAAQPKQVLVGEALAMAA